MSIVECLLAQRWLLLTGLGGAMLLDNRITSSKPKQDNHPSQVGREEFSYKAFLIDYFKLLIHVDVDMQSFSYALLDNFQPLRNFSRTHVLCSMHKHGARKIVDL